MNNDRGQFQDVSDNDFNEIIKDPKKKGKLFKIGEIVKIKESYFKVRNIDFTGIITLKLLKTEEASKAYEIQENL